MKYLILLLALQLTGCASFQDLESRVIALESLAQTAKDEINEIQADLKIAKDEDNGHIKKLYHIENGWP